MQERILHSFAYVVWRTFWFLSVARLCGAEHGTQLCECDGFCQDNGGFIKTGGEEGQCHGKKCRCFCMTTADITNDTDYFTVDESAGDCKGLTDFEKAMVILGAIVLALVLAFCGLCCLCCYWCKKSRRQASENREETQDTELATANPPVKLVEHNDT